MKFYQRMYRKKEGNNDIVNTYAARGEIRVEKKLKAGLNIGLVRQTFQ